MGKLTAVVIGLVAVFSMGSVYLNQSVVDDTGEESNDRVSSASFLEDKGDSVPPKTRQEEPAFKDTKKIANDVDWQAIENRGYSSAGGAMYWRNPDAVYSETEISAYDELHVIPFERFSRNGVLCAEVEYGRKECFEDVAESPHPYRQLETEVLESLSITDAAASMILAERVRRASYGERNTDKRIQLQEKLYHLHLRAVALSEKPGPLMKFASMNYIVSPEPSDYGQGQSALLLARGDFATMYKRMAVETVAQKLGDPRADPEKWRKPIQDLAVRAEISDSPEKIFQKVDQLVEEALVHMRAVQQEITGSVQMARVIDKG